MAIKHPTPSSPPSSSSCPCAIPMFDSLGRKYSSTMRQKIGGNERTQCPYREVLSVFVQCSCKCRNQVLVCRMVPIDSIPKVLPHRPDIRPSARQVQVSGNWVTYRASLHVIPHRKSITLFDSFEFQKIGSRATSSVIPQQEQIELFHQTPKSTRGHQTKVALASLIAKKAHL